MRYKSINYLLLFLILFALGFGAVIPVFTKEIGILPVYKETGALDVGFTYTVDGCYVYCKGYETGSLESYRWMEVSDNLVMTGVTDWIDYSDGDTITYGTYTTHSTSVNITLQGNETGVSTQDSFSRRIETHCPVLVEPNPEIKSEPKPVFPEAKAYSEVPIGEWKVDAGSICFLLIASIIAIVLWFRRKNRPPRGWKYVMP